MFAFLLCFTLQTSTIKSLEIVNPKPSYKSTDTIRLRITYNNYDEYDNFFLAYLFNEDKTVSHGYVDIYEAVPDGQNQYTKDIQLKEYKNPSDGKYLIKLQNLDNEDVAETSVFEIFNGPEKLDACGTNSDTKDSYNSKTVDFFCIEFAKSGSSKFMAALENPDDPRSYKFPIRPGEGTGDFLVDLTENTDDTSGDHDIYLAFINNGEITLKTEIYPTLYGKPILSELMLMSPSQSKIQKNSKLTFQVNIANAVDPNEGHLMYAIYKNNQETPTFSKTQLSGDDNPFSFNVDLPSTDEETEYTMKVKFYEIEEVQSAELDMTFTVHVNKLGGCQLKSSSNAFTLTSSIPLTCGSLFVEDGYELKAKFTDSSDNSYNIPVSYNGNDVTVDLSDNQDTSSHTSITLAIVSKSDSSPTTKTTDVAVNLYGKPQLDSLVLTKPDQSTIKAETELTFNVKITNAIDPSKGHIKYSVYRGDSIPSDDQLAGKDDTITFEPNNKIATFEVNVPDNAQSGTDYKVRVLFYEREDILSDPISSSSFAVHINSIQNCRVANAETKYAVDAQSIEFACEIQRVGGYELMAKFENDAQYTIGPLSFNEQGHFSIDLHDKGIIQSGQKYIYFALVKGSDIGSNSDTTVMLYGTPTLSKPALKNPDDKIEPESDVKFAIDITNAVNPLSGSVSCKVHKVDSSATEESNVNCQLNSEGSSSYTLSLKAPKAAMKENYNLEVKFFEIQEKSATQTSDSFTVYANSINCHLANPDSTYNLQSNSIELQCDDLFVQKNNVLKAKFGSQSNYQFSTTPNYEANPITVSVGLTGLDQNGPGQNNLQLAIVNSESSDVKFGPKDIPIKLYGIPKLSNLRPVQPADITQVKQKTSIQMSVTITDAVNPVKGTITYAFYESNQDKSQIQYTDATGFTESQNNAFTFTIKAPSINQNPEKTFNLAVKFQEQNGNPSQPLEYGNQITVKSSTIDCELANKQAKYKIDASDIMLDCKLDLEEGHIFMAKIGEMNHNANDYKLPLKSQKSGDKTSYVLDLSEQNEKNSQTKLSFAILSGSPGQYTIVKEDDAEVELFGKPSLENLRLSTPDETEIEKGKHLTYVVGIKNAITGTSGTLKYGLYKDNTLVGDETTQEITSVSESATFELDVPNDAGKDSTYQVKVTFNQIADEISDPASATFTVLANSISCTPQKSQYQVDSTITLTCTIEKVGGYNLKAKVGKTSGVANDYNLDVIQQGTDSQTYTIDLATAHISKSQTSIAVALVKEGVIGVEANVDVKLYGTPGLDGLTLLSSSERIQRNTELNFKVKITNAIDPQKIQYAFVNEDQTSTNPTYVDAKEFHKATEESMYTFKVTVPSDASDANYKVKVKFFEIQERKSNTPEQAVKVNLNRLSGCELSDKQGIYTVKSSISFTCQSIFVEDGSVLKAKLNNLANEFPTKIVGKTVSVDLQGNTDTTIKTSLTLAITSGSSKVAKQTIDNLKLYGTPTLGIESVTGSTNPIQRGTTLSLNLQIGNTFELESGKVKIVLFKIDQLPNSGFGNIDPSKFTPSNPTNNKYKFEITVPNNADAGEYILRVQFVDNGKQESPYKDSASIIVKVNKLSCVLKSTEASFGAQSRITFTCDSMIVGGKIKAKLGGESDASNDFNIAGENWHEGKNVDYTLDLSKVQFGQVFESVTFAIVDEEKVSSKSVINNMMIVAAPKINSIVDVHPGATYNYTQSITVKIDVKFFYKFLDAKINYMFVEDRTTPLGEAIRIQNKPEPINGSPNQYMLTIPIPESEKKGSNKYLGIEFTDPIGQKVAVYSENKFIIDYIVDVQPLKEGQNKVTVENDDFIRVTLTLSNLKDGWENTLQFGYKFDDLNMEILKKEHYKKSESSRKLFEVGPQKFDLEIPVPKNLSNGKHKLSVFVVNENKLQISEQSLFDVDIKKGDKGLGGKPEGPSSPLGIIVAVVVIVLIIIAVAIIVFIIYKKKSSNENNKEEEEVEKEDGETHMNIYDEGGTTLENALSVTATNADIFESGSGSEDNDNEEVHVEI